MLILTQRNLPAPVFELLDRELGYEAADDHFGRGDRGFLRVEEIDPNGALVARATLAATGWRNLPGLDEQAVQDRDLEDAFIEVAARLPLDYLQWLSGCRLHYDTESFRHGEQGDYFWDFVLRGRAEAVARAYRELKRAADLRWKKAHRAAGYHPVTGEFDEEAVRRVVDAAWGGGTWERWRQESAALDADLSRYYREVNPPDWSTPTPDQR